MRNLFFLAALCVATFTLLSCNQAETTKPAEAAMPMPAKPDLAKVKSEIQALETAFAAAKDGAAVSNFYAEDAITMPDDKPALRGKVAIAQDADEYIAKRPAGTTVTYETLEVFGDENLVTEIGSVKRTDTTGKVVSSGKYMALWQKRDGQWLTIRDMSNDDAKDK